MWQKTLAFDFVCAIIGLLLKKLMRRGGQLWCETRERERERERELSVSEIPHFGFAVVWGERVKRSH
jgi:hypothetical protein